MRRRDSPGHRLAIWFGIFTVIFLLGFFYRYLQDVAMRQSGTFRTRLIEEFTGCYSAALLFLLVLKFCRRFRIDSRNWPRRLPAYLFAGVVFSLLHTTMMALSRQAVFRIAGMGAYDYGIMPIRYLMEMANYLMFYTAGVTLIHLYDHYRESRERELRTAQLEAQLAQAEFQSLQTQIHPHFLFNALNTISSVVYEDPRAADTMIARLSDFLRHSINASRRQEVTLQEELNFLNLYLDIMRPRFEDRLSVKIDVEPGVNDALAPRLILQPLVENSIKYAADPDSGRINIVINAARENGSLRIEVRDDGPGLASNVRGAAGNGMGLANTARRLERLYGRDHEFAMRNGESGGAMVCVKLPYHTDGDRE
ncbi:MAG: histidine kinase [Blastocatellia bacterium]|nr:histidine kinase [Blastocatellia bacterium]